MAARTRTKKDLKKLLKTVEKRKVPKLNPDQKLSLCLITKNESENIARCLESVEGVVDEIILVDTGSTDDTVEIAKKYGAKVYNYEWSNDFSAARNYSIKHATGDWILVLDADEELSADSKDKIRAFLVDVGSEMYYQLRIKNLDEKDKVLHQNYMIRFFKNVPTAQYVGRIHETIIPKTGFVNISEGDVQIIHHGYKNKGKTLKKVSERNIPILESIIQDESVPDDYKSFVNYYIGSSNIGAGKQEEAIAYLRDSINLIKDVDKKPIFAVHPYLKLMNLYIILNKFDDLSKLIEESKNECKEILTTYEYWYYKGVLDYYNKDFDKAIDNFKKSINTYNNKEFEHFRLSTDVAIYHFALLNLSNSYKEIGDTENALQYLDLTLEETNKNFDYPQFKLSIAKSYVELDQVDKSIDLCKNLLDEVPENSKKNVATILSNLYLKANKFPETIRLQSDLHDPELVKDNWYAIISSLEDEKYFPAAEEAYDAVLEALPEETRAYMGRAVARLIQNKTVDALADMAQAKQFAENEDKLKLGLLYTQIGQLVQGKSCIQEVLEDSPEDYDANLYMASIEQSEGKVDESVDRLERLIQMYTFNPKAHIQLGNLLLSNQRVDQALEIFNKAVDIDDLNPYVYYALALCYLEKKDKEKALESLEKSLKLEPENQELENLKNMIENEIQVESENSNND